VLDVKPKSIEIDLEKIKDQIVANIHADGLLWG
jgi:translation elongation factor EF-1beta